MGGGRTGEGRRRPEVSPGRRRRKGCDAFSCVHSSGSTNRSWALLTHHGLCSFPGPAGPSPNLQQCSHHPPQRQEARLDTKKAPGISQGWLSSARAYSSGKSLLEGYLRPKGAASLVLGQTRKDRPALTGQQAHSGGVSQHTVSRSWIQSSESDGSAGT